MLLHVKGASFPKAVIFGEDVEIYRAAAKKAAKEKLFQGERQYEYEKDMHTWAVDKMTEVFPDIPVKLAKTLAKNETRNV